MSDRMKHRVTCIEIEQSSDEDELFSYLETTHPINPTSKVRRPINNDTNSEVSKESVSGNGEELDKRNLTGIENKQDSGRLETALNRLQNNSEKKDGVQHRTILTADIGPGYSDIDADKHGSGVNKCMTTPEAGTADKLVDENNTHAEVNQNNPEKISECFDGITKNYQQDSCSFDGTNAKQEQSKQDLEMGESNEKAYKESDPKGNENKFYLINEKDWLSLCAKISDSEMQEHVEIADHETQQLGVSTFTGANSEKMVTTNSQVMNTSPVKSPLKTSPVKSPILDSSRGTAMFNLFKQYGSVSNAAPRKVSFIRSPVKSKSHTDMKVDQHNSPTEPHTSSVSDNVTRKQYKNVIIGRSKTEENNTTLTIPKVEIVYIRLEDGQIKYDDMNLPIGTTESKYDSSPQVAVRKLDFCEDRFEISQNNDLPNAYIDQQGQFVMQSVLNSARSNTAGAHNLTISGGHGRFVRINNKLMRVLSTEQNIVDDVLGTSQEVYNDEHIPFIEEGYDENDSFSFDDSQLVAYPVNAIDPDMINSDSLTLLTPSKLDLLDNIDINLSPEKLYTNSSGYMPALLSDGSSSESPIVLKVTRSGELVPCRGNEKNPVQKISTPKRHVATGEYGVVKDQGAHIRSLWTHFKPQNSGKCARNVRSHIAASEDPDCEIMNNVEDECELSSDENVSANYFKQKNLTGISSESSKTATVLAQPLKENVSNAVASTSSCSISIQASFTDSEDESNHVEIVRTKTRTRHCRIFQHFPYKQVNFKDFESEVDLESQLKEKPEVSRIDSRAFRFKGTVKIDSRTKHYDEAIAATVNRVYKDDNLMKEKSFTDSDETRVCDEMAPIKRTNNVQSHPDKQVSWNDKTDICVYHGKPVTAAEEKPDVQHKPKNLAVKRQSGKIVAVKNSDRSLIGNDTKDVKQTKQKVEANKLRGKPKGKKSQNNEPEITYVMRRELNTERIEHNSVNTKIYAKDNVKIDSRTKHYDEAIAAIVNRVYKDDNLMKEKSFTDSDETRVCDEMAPTKRPNNVQSHPDKQVSWKDKTDICVYHGKPITVAEEKPDVQHKPNNLAVKTKSGKIVSVKNSDRSLIGNDTKEVKQTKQKVEANKPKGKRSQKNEREIVYAMRGEINTERIEHNSVNTKSYAKDKVKIDSRTKHYDEAIAAIVNRVYKDDNLMKEKSFTDSDETRVCDEMAPTKRPNNVQSHPDKQVSWKDKTDIFVDHGKPVIAAEEKSDVQHKPKNLAVKRQSGKIVAVKNSDRSLIANDMKDFKHTIQQVDGNKLKGKPKGKKSQKNKQQITYLTRGKINTERIEHNSINTKIEVTCTTKMTDDETSLNSVKSSKIDFLEKLFHVKLKEAAIDTANRGENICLNSCESRIEELCDTNNLTDNLNGDVSVGTTTEVKRPRGRPRKDATTVFKRIKAVSVEITRKTFQTESQENRVCDNLKGDPPTRAERSDSRPRKHENTGKASAVDVNMKTVPQFDKIQKTELRGTDNTMKQGVSSSDKDSKLKKPRGSPRLSTNTTKSKDAEIKLGRKEISNAEDKSSHPDPLIVKKPRRRPKLKKNGSATRLNVNIANREIGSEKSQKRKQPKTPHKKVKIKGGKHDLNSSSNTDMDTHGSDSVLQGEDISYLGKFQPLEQTVTKITSSKRKRKNNEYVVRRKSQKINSGINESDAKGEITSGNENIKRKGRKRKSFGLDSDELDLINDVNLSLPKEKNVGQDSSSGNKMTLKKSKAPCKKSKAPCKKSKAPFSKQLRDGKEIRQTREMKKSPGSLKSAKKPVSRVRLKATSKRHANDSWKDMLEDEAFKFDFDERINEEHRPVNVRRMIRKILKSTKISDNSKVVKVKHRERKDKHRERSDADARLRLTSESDDAWLSDSGPSASFPAFRFAGIDELKEENQPENYIPLKKTTTKVVKESSQVEVSSRKEMKERNQSDGESRLSESQLVKQTFPTGNDKTYMELHHSPVKDVSNKIQQEFKQSSSVLLENPSDMVSNNPKDAVGNAKSSSEVKRNVNRLIALLDKVGDKKTVNS